jgi:hypothetical protein
MKNVTIYLLLREKIPIKEIINKILDEKDRTERREALEYHVDQWDIISSKYFRSFERSPYTVQYNYYSYVLDGGKSYKYEKDRNSEFYNYAGISYQCRDLLLSTIKDESIEFDRKDMIIDSKRILDKEKMDWLKYNDKIYSILSKKIMSAF